MVASVVLLSCFNCQTWSQVASPKSDDLESIEEGIEVVSADEIMDTQSSIDDASSELGWVARGDLRSLYFFDRVENANQKRDRFDAWLRVSLRFPLREF